MPKADGVEDEQASVIVLAQDSSLSIAALG